MLEDTEAGEAPHFFFAINVLLLADRLDPAEHALQLALARARRYGSAPGFAFASGWRCWLYARQGNLVAAEAEARSCTELSLSQGWFVVVPTMLATILSVLLERGELTEARDLLTASGMENRMPDADVTADALVHARVRMRAADGDLDGARHDLDALEQAAVTYPRRWNTTPSLTPPILIAPELAARDTQRMRVDELLRQAHAWGTSRAIGMAVHAAALTEPGEKSLKLLREAVGVLERSPAHLELARALADLGAAERRVGQRSAAREVLRKALDAAERCGARPLADRVRQELRAAGGRPRQARITGVSALTASELRVAKMAATRLSNAEIAQGLFVTKKTVEAHLAGAYRKPGINSRFRLARALGDEVS